MMNWKDTAVEHHAGKRRSLTMTAKEPLSADLDRLCLFLYDVL